VLRPGRQGVVDHGEKFEGRREPDVGDRRLGAADERFAVHVERMKDVQRLCDRLCGRLLRRILGRGVGVARADLAGILRKAQRRIGRAGDIGIERADDIEHRAVDHRARRRRLGIEAVEMVRVAQILHDGAAFPHHALRQIGGFHHRRQMGGILRQEPFRAGLAVDVVLGEFQLRRAHENARRHIVHARLQNMQFDRRHSFLPLF
jgi:hypothetical protein